MPSLGEIYDRLSDELARSDLSTTQIPRAVRSAITHYETERFHFNEAIGSFSLTSSQEYYTQTDFAPLGTSPQIDRLSILIDDTPYELRKVGIEQIEAWSAGTTDRGDPYNFAYYADQIRVWPIPDQGRTVRAFYIERFATLTATASTNAWLTYAEELIVARAKLTLFRSVIRPDSETGMVDIRYAQEQEAEAYRALRHETTRRKATGRVVPTYW